MSSPKPNAELLKSIEGEKDLKQVETKESSTLTQAKLLKSLEKDHTKDLKHTTTQESSTLTQAKVLLEVAKKPELAHVDEVAGEGLTDAQKAAYLEDKKGGAKQ